MTDIVFPSPGRGAVPDEWAAISRYGHGTSDGWVVDSSIRLVSDAYDANISSGALGGFAIASTSSSSFDVTVDTGEALVAGRYVARDTQTTVTVPSNSTTTLVVGLDQQTRDDVVVDTSGTPDIELTLADVTTDSNGVTGTTDKRVQGPVDPAPSGVIQMWSGTTSNVPRGWTLCDGSNPVGPDSEVPDLRDRFVAGAGSQYTIGDTGGEDQHQLTESELASHDHTGSTDTDGSHQHEYDVEDATGDVPSESDISTVTVADFSPKFSNVTRPFDAAGAHSHSLNINDAGSNNAHENRPPYYALAYIYKL